MMRLVLRQTLRDPWWMGVALLALATCGQPSAHAANLVAAPQLGLRVTAGFRVTVFADASLADDIYAMAFDPRGNVVVTGRGYIRTLYDDNRDGAADRAVDYANTPGGGMGMCFDGNQLMFVGDGAIWRFDDVNGDGQADGAPVRVLSLPGGEHGAHAVRKGPDGAWYVLGGNDSKFSAAQLAMDNAPPGKIEAGALLRLGDPGRASLVAHGLRNPYDFDWNSDGALFTYDSDVERDFFLPWYLPTRVYHLAPGGHHGWRLAGHTRSWPRPGYYMDSVEALAEVGRGSPTGVACYRHTQFPEYFHNGLFALDWTFGRLYFVPLEPAGSTYRGVPEVFLESIGTQGFAPTDIAVAPDGSLFVSTGGRSTRGAVYRIQYVAEPARLELAARWHEAVDNPVQLVIVAPQPLEAWSRAIWLPEAARLDAGLFETVATDNRIPAQPRIRAIEVLTEVHEGLRPGVALTCAQSAAPEVRARVAWSVGVKTQGNVGPLLLGLARDNAAVVRCAALDTLCRLQPVLDRVTVQQALALNLGHADKRVRQRAAQLAAGLPDPAWTALWKQQEQPGGPQARLTTTLAALWRDGVVEAHAGAIESALTLLNQNRAPDFRQQALRLILLGLGDYHLEQPAVEVYTAYEAALPLALADQALAKRLEKTLVDLVPSGDARVDQEAARLLAVIESADARAPGKIIANCTARSVAASDFHYLVVFSRLRSRAVTNFTATVADTLLGLDRKLDSIASRPREAWGDRFVELTQALLKNDPRLADALMRHPSFARPTHLSLVPLLAPERYTACARIFSRAVQSTPDFRWSEPLVDLLTALPPEETHPLFRRQLDNATVRERVLIELATKPQPGDRPRFVAALSSPRPEVVRASMTALLQLPNDPGQGTTVAVLRVLRALLKQPAEQTARAQAIALLDRLAGQKFKVEERGPDWARAYAPVFSWFETKNPGLARQLDGDDNESPAQWEVLLQGAPWTRGDADRGYGLYASRACQICHEGARALGPDLAGVAQRYSPSDLLRTILFPSREVAPAYRATTFRMRDGLSYTGLLAFESADGVILRTGQSATVRLGQADIVGREPSTVSFMPSGLLVGLKGQDLADLYAYLQTLRAPDQK